MKRIRRHSRLLILFCIQHYELNIYTHNKYRLLLVLFHKHFLSIYDINSLAELADATAADVIAGCIV